MQNKPNYGVLALILLIICVGLSQYQLHRMGELITKNSDRIEEGQILIGQLTIQNNSDLIEHRDRIHYGRLTRGKIYDKRF